MTSGLCECGCGEPVPIAVQNHTRFGWVKGQPMRFIRGHNNRGRAMKAERWREEDRGYRTPCWIWQLGLALNGYGRVKRYGKQFHAHRIVWEEHHGPVPNGLELDHLCRNRACVNPDHLEPVTHHVNMQRGSGTKLTDDDVIALRAHPGPLRVAAECFGISVSYASAIRTGRQRSLSR